MREIVEKYFQEGEHEQLSTSPLLPFTLSVESPADETGVRTTADVLALQQQLFRSEHCSLSTCGWTANFTVASEQDGVLDRVRGLLEATGCTVTDERRYRMKDDALPHRRQRQMDPWNSQWEPLERPAPVVRAEPEKIPYEAQVESFLHELEEILLQRHLDPHDFAQLLTVAHEIVDVEDPQSGPHAGMIIVLEDVLKARGGQVMPASVSA